MEEIWKVYKETYSSRYGHRVYEVSNLGNVKINGELVVFDDSSTGYYSVAVGRVHRMVAELFIPNHECKPCVDHIDTNPHNNRIDNLRWVTHKENNNNPLTRKHMHDAQIEFWSNSEHKQKQSETMKVVLNKPEVKQKMSESAKKHIGEKNNFFGKHHTDETKQKLSNSHKGKKLSDEHKRNIGIKSKLALNKPEVKKKISEHSSNSKWINKDNKTKFVHISQLNLFLNNGWKLGRK